jgi:Clostripain family
MANEDAAWTVLVYMAGDNNLTEDMVWGLQELKKASAALEAKLDAKSKGRINVLAHFDPRGSRSRRYDFLPRGTTQETTPIKPGATSVPDGDLTTYESAVYTRRQPQDQDTQPKPEREALQTASASNPLASFVSKQIEHLPIAKRYFLVLSGHGSGAVGDFLNDSDPTTSLSIPKLAAILGEARKQGGPHLSILGMDSCLMSNAEVCCEVAEYADYLVASEGWVANAGWPYHRVLEACLDDKGRILLDPERVASRVSNNFAAFYRDYEISEISTDIAVCRLEAFQARGANKLVKALEKLSAEFTRAFDTVFVAEELSRTAIDDAAAQRLRRKLRREIDEQLSQAGTHTDKLLEGSAGIRNVLEEAPHKGLGNSQWRAVRMLARSSGLGEGRDGNELELLLEPKWSDVVSLFDKRHSPSVALDLVRAKRELDPGVGKALDVIESLKESEPTIAMRARISLQKYHQVQSALDLRALVKKPPRDEVSAAQALLDAIVLARWEAQSFKGGVYVDLADFCCRLEKRLRKGDKARTLCEAVHEAAVQCTFATHQTGPASQHAKGLSVYSPYQTSDYRTEYDNLLFAKLTGWGRVIHSYLRATRRPRRNEAARWHEPQSYVLRFGRNEVDLLEPNGIEARIVGVVTSAARGEETRFAGKDGTEAKARDGTEAKARDGTEAKARDGTEAKARDGTEAKARGEGVQFVWGNPPDGFFRQGGDDRTSCE